MGGRAALDRKVPSNPRFASVQTRLNTGPNLRKILEQSQGTSGAFAHKKKPNEFYVRLKPATLGRLLAPLVQAEESVYKLANEDAASCISSVLPEAVDAASSQGNILIFDLRPFDVYQQCHVFGAKHYDTTLLNRASNNFPQEVYFYKVRPETVAASRARALVPCSEALAAVAAAEAAAPWVLARVGARPRIAGSLPLPSVVEQGSVECDKMVVLYDADGKLGPSIGNAFVEKGIENTYVISGGFLGLCAASPELLVGELPSEETLAMAMAKAGFKPGGTGTPSALSSRCSTAGSVRTQRTGLTSQAGSPGRGPRAWK